MSGTQADLSSSPSQKRPQMKRWVLDVSDNMMGKVFSLQTYDVICQGVVAGTIYTRPRKGVSIENWFSPSWV